MTSVTTVVSLTLLRAGQWELLAFALANALAKWDMVIGFETQTREAPLALLAGASNSPQWSQHLLQGTSGCAARLMSRFANALANANARRSHCLARRSVKLTTVVTPVTTTSFKALVGAQAKRVIKPIFYRLPRLSICCSLIFLQSQTCPHCHDQFISIKARQIISYAFSPSGLINWGRP